MAIGLTGRHLALVVLLAAVREEDPEEVARLTTRNACEVLSLDLASVIKDTSLLPPAEAPEQGI